MVHSQGEHHLPFYERCQGQAEWCVDRNCGTVWCLLSVMSQLLCGAITPSRIRSTALGTSDSVSCTVCARRGGEELESDTTCRNIVSRLTPCTHFAQVSASPGKTSLRG